MIKMVKMVSGMSCDENTPDAYCEQRRTARKEHICCACKETIRTRDQYVYISGIWEGAPNSFKQCLRCNQLMCLISDEPDNTGVQIDLQCGHAWQDVFSDDPPERVQRLAFMTRDEAQKEFVR